MDNLSSLSSHFMTITTHRELEQEVKHFGCTELHVYPGHIRTL